MLTSGCVDWASEVHSSNEELLEHLEMCPYVWGG